MCASVLNTELWDEIILKYLTPRPIGLLECTCTTMKETIKKNKVWKHQAVLAWNGFYRNWEDQAEYNDQNHLSEIPKFVFKYCSEYTVEFKMFVTDFSSDEDWYNWDKILSQMEIFDDGYKTIGYVTTDPKVVVQNELQITLDEYYEMEDNDERKWVNILKDEFWHETKEYSDESDSNYDSDTSYYSFTTSDSIDGEKGWQ